MVRRSDAGISTAPHSSVHLPCCHRIPGSTAGTLSASQWTRLGARVVVVPGAPERVVIGRRGVMKASGIGGTTQESARLASSAAGGASCVACWGFGWSGSSNVIMLRLALYPLMGHIASRPHHDSHVVCAVLAIGVSVLTWTASVFKAVVPIGTNSDAATQCGDHPHLWSMLTWRRLARSLLLPTHTG